MDNTYTKEEFGRIVKQKYPEYSGMSDVDVAEKVLTKYPEYGEKIKEKGIGADIKQIGTDIKESAIKRADTFGEIDRAQAKGEQGTFRSFLQKGGQALGFASDVIGSTVIGGIKALTPQKTQEKIGSAVSGAVEKVAQTDTVQNILKQYESLDEKTKRDISSAIGAGSLIADVVGGSLLKKPLQEGAEGFVKTALKGSDKSIEAFNNIKKVVSNTSQDIIPTKKGFINTEIVKALDLTQGDVKNIFKQTKNQVGDFIADNNLIGDNLESTVKNIDGFFKQNYDTVRQEINNVKNVYKSKVVPRYKDALDAISKQVDDVVGLEEVSKEVGALLKKKDLTLNDVQRVKELMDDHLNLYKITGDVKEGATKEGLTKVRKDIQSFIEREVKQNTGVDIKPINKNVQTSKAITNAIADRITRGSTRATITAGDVITFLTGSGFGSPVGGVLAVLGKKLYQSPSAKLKFTKWFNSKSLAEKAKIAEDLQNGVVPKGLNLKTKK